jgi:hypothetical protein
MTTIAAASHAHAGPFPVTVSIEAPSGARRRLLAFFRPLLAIPHIVLVGPASAVHRTGAAGLIGAAAYFLGFVNWVLILFRGHGHPGISNFQMFYLRWRTRALAYTALFVDTYPPFGDGPYPASVEVTLVDGPRDRLMVALRPILAIPHLVCLAFLLMAWFVTTLLAWVAMTVTGRYPESLRGFGYAVMGWLVRVEAYALLLVDEYPPFGW